MTHLIAHWPLKGDAEDKTRRHPGVAHTVTFGEGPFPHWGAVRFASAQSRIEAPPDPEFLLASGPAVRGTSY